MVLWGYSGGERRGNYVVLFRSRHSRPKYILGNDIGCGCLRTKCLWEYIDLQEMKWKGRRKNFNEGSHNLYSRQILL